MRGNDKQDFITRTAEFSIKHRRIVGISWVVSLLCLTGLAGLLGTKYASNFSLPGTDSQKAADVLKKNFPARNGDNDQIVFKFKRGSFATPQVKNKINVMLNKVSESPQVSSVVSPYSLIGKDQISPDKTIAFATILFNKQANLLPVSAIKHVVITAKSAESPQLQVELGGLAIEEAQSVSLESTTGIGIAAAIIILLITFGSLLAMGLPIATALLGLGTGIALIELGTHVIEMPNFSTQLATMIGLGVGIDYSLFIVTRFRENYANSGDVHKAIVYAMNTAGRAVFFAGCTVIIALMGMFALGVSFLYGLAIAASLAVLMTMFAALTVLPAMLSLFGKRLGKKQRIKVKKAQKQKNKSTAPQGFWGRWSTLIQKHPVVGTIVGLSIMLLLAAPALSLRLGSSDAGNDPTNQTTRKAYDLLSQGFGQGFNGPLLVVAKLPTQHHTAALENVAVALKATPGVASVSPPQLSPKADIAVLSVYPSSSPQSVDTTKLIKRLRSKEFPSTTVLIGGITAVGIDFTNVLSDKLPLFISLVILLSALLLMVVFRSIVIPIQAAIMNLLSIGASMGIVVAIFQKGFLASIFNVQDGPIEAFLPVMVFAIVFGLSMDYEVFIISRIHEEWERRQDPSAAVAHGLAATGRVVTAAATIMVCVFLSFVLGDTRVLKLFGLALASAVFLDAFVVRSLLLPATLELFGRTTWKLPKFLQKHLPHLKIDEEENDSHNETIRS